MKIFKNIGLSILLVVLGYLSFSCQKSKIFYSKRSLKNYKSEDSDTDKNWIKIETKQNKDEVFAALGLGYKIACFLFSEYKFEKGKKYYDNCINLINLEKLDKNDPFVKSIINKKKFFELQNKKEQSYFSMLLSILLGRYTKIKYLESNFDINTPKYFSKITVTKEIADSLFSKYFKN